METGEQMTEPAEPFPTVANLLVPFSPLSQARSLVPVSNITEGNLAHQEIITYNWFNYYMYTFNIFTVDFF